MIHSSQRKPESFEGLKVTKQGISIAPKTYKIRFNKHNCLTEFVVFKRYFQATTTKIQSFFLIQRL